MMIGNVSLMGNGIGKWLTHVVNFLCKCGALGVIHKGPSPSWDAGCTARNLIQLLGMS